MVVVGATVVVVVTVVADDVEGAALETTRNVPVVVGASVVVVVGGTVVVVGAAVVVVVRGATVVEDEPAGVATGWKSKVAGVDSARLQAARNIVAATTAAIEMRARSARRRAMPGDYPVERHTGSVVTSHAYLT